MSRRDWDKEFVKLQQEDDEETLKQHTTSAVIAGRLSMVLAAEKAINDGLTFEQFIQVMQYIVAMEVKSGKVDGSTFEIPKGITDSNDGLPGI